MTDAPFTVVCANCGAKYKLPPTFSAAKAKCKTCSASIDVAGQRAAAEAPPAAAAPKPRQSARRAEPAASASRPARGSSGRSARGSGSSRPARSSSRRRGGDDGDGDEGGRHGRRSAGAKAGGGNGMMIASVVGIVIVLGAGAWFFFLRGGDAPPPTTEATAKAEGGAKTEMAPRDEQPATDELAAAKDAAREAMKTQLGGVLDQIAAQDAAARTDLEKSMDAALDAAFSSDAAGGADKVQQAVADAMLASLGKSESPAIKDNLDALRAALGVAPAKADDGAKPTEDKHEPERQMTMAEVFDPKSLPALEYPEYVEPALREEIEGLCRDLPMGGVKERRAQARLAEIGHPAIVGVLNAYRDIDFTNPDTSMYAFGMNRFITDSFGAGVVNSEFKQTLAGEPIPPDVADWNGKTVKAWQRFWEKFADKAHWEEWVAERRKSSQKN